MDLKVLVVDDDEIFLLLHDFTVIESGLASSTLGFEEAEKALEYLEEHYTEDESYLILLDINMPIMNGWQFLDSIRNAPYSNQIHVAIVSSSIDYEDHIKAQQYSQVIDYIEKPLDIKKATRLKEKYLVTHH